jgi:hypothetical protein
MSSTASPCKVFVFDIDHEMLGTSSPVQHAGRHLERAVRIVASDEQTARHRLLQMYPHWRVLSVQMLPFDPRIQRSGAVHQPKNGIST